MMDKWSLPTSVLIDDSIPLSIRGRGDFRVILDVIAALNDVELEADEKAEAALTIFLDPSDMGKLTKDNVEAVIRAMIDFINGGGQKENKTPQHHKLMDWDDDAPFIVAGVNRVLGREIRSEPYLHWWTFLSAYHEIGDGVFSNIVGIRDKVARGKKLEKAERTFLNEHPEYFHFSSDKKRAEMDMQDIEEIWNQGD